MELRLALLILSPLMKRERGKPRSFWVMITGGALATCSTELKETATRSRCGGGRLLGNSVVAGVVIDSVDAQAWRGDCASDVAPVAAGAAQRPANM